MMTETDEKIAKCARVLGRGERTHFKGRFMAGTEPL